MSNLLELAIDLINDAKGGRDAQGKLFLLEQVKEICFHRDKSVLKDIIPSILDFMVEKSVSIKRYLVKFVEEAMGQEPQLSFPYYLNLLNFLLSDANDSVLALMIKSFQKYYDVILINIVSMPVAAKAQGLSDPKQLWQMLSTLTNQFNDFIATNKSDAVKMNCLRLYESQMLFGLPSPAPTTSDPRLARKDPRLARASKAGPASTPNAPGGTNTGKNAEEIPLHHPFISRNEIQQSAEDCFQRVLLWSSKGGTQSHPFSPAMMSMLGQVIANVASSRLKHASTAAKALVAMIQSKSNVAQEMSGGDRGNLARAIHRLLRSATAYTADPEGMMPKLRLAVTSLEALGLDVAGEAAGPATVLKKRGRGAAAAPAESNSVSTPVGEDDDSEEAAAQRRSSAVAAIDAAEEKMKSLSVFPDLTGDGGDDAIAMLLATVSSSTKTAPKSTVGMGGMLISGDVTELAKDLSIEDDNSSRVGALKVVNTASEKSAGAAAATTIQRPLHQTSEDYGALALCSMQKLLESFSAIEQTNVKMLKPFSILCLKTVLSIALSEVEAGAAYVPVQVLSIIPAAMAGKLAADAPTHVTLPKSLWIFLGFALTSPAPQGDNSRDERWEEELQRKVAILSQVCVALHEEIAWLQEDNAEEGASVEQTELISSLRAVYDALVIAAMSRMIQTPQLRSSLSAYMIGLPSVPAQCIGLLKLLFATGTKSSTSGTGAGGAGRDRHAMATEAARNRGTRSEATALLAQLVFSQDETAGRDSLYHLLYSCLSDDFETRTKVVNLIVSDIVHLEDWCDEMVTRFALQAMIGAVGPEVVQAWYEQLPEEECAEGDSKEQQQQTGEEDKMAVESVVDMAMEGVEEGEPHTTAAATGTPPRGCSFRTACREFFADELTRLSFPVVAPAEREAYAKKAVQLLSQLCLVDISMLTAFTQLYSAWSVGSSNQGSADNTTTGTVNSEGIEASAEDMAAEVTTAGVEEEKEEKDATEEANVIVPATGGKTAVVWTLAETLKSELRNILPAIAQSNTIEKVFETMTQDKDTTVRPLLEYVLNVLLADYTVPPTASLIEKVRTFALLTEEILPKSELNEMEVEAEQDNNNSTSSTTAPTTATTTTSSTTETVIPPILYDLQNTANFTLMLPLVGGMNGKEIERCLPRIIALYTDSGNPDALKVTFTRITRARPPPLTKSSLLVALHRIDFESQNMKAKTILDAIAVCLNNKSDYSGEIVKDALRTMLPDDPPPYALMRTAILSAQSFSEVKRFVLSDIIPQLVRRMVWTTAPKLWEGVVYGAKNLAASGFKNSEYTLRALLGVPVAQLKSLLRVAPTVKTAMGKLLKTLSAEEKEEVISGKWAGLTGEDSDTTVSEEKEKLIKDIAASVTL